MMDTLWTGTHVGLRERQDAAISALCAMSAVLNPAAAAHSDATALLAARMASTLGVDEATIFRVERIGRVHDIGLNGVDPLISEKRDPLTEREFETLRLHAERGAAILAATPALAEWAPIVRSHHERFDGTGYPDGLLGAEIPLESRIIAVADAFQAMTTPHRWRAMIAPFAAVQELLRNAGTQFDPDVVEALTTTLSVRRAGSAAQSA
ncbi:MAG TPA: HD domain-containing phosphohydrolase [Candidatus Lustribacter sp.]|jgi:HD-GYP domain-containing protein (c-di-GMP phosphodiesterase class II)|nr:HD domain-containing phosphohydrolase [Candidatus Lustribacter sp.]